jgi:hypothetical protein
VENPNFLGVIHVTGRVAVSGTVLGRLTLAATGNIIIVDDLVYNTPPDNVNCNNIVGLFSGANIVVADNSMNSPRTSSTNPNANSFFSMNPGSPTNETIHAVLLTLGSFQVHNFNEGATTTEPCNGSNWGRGCLRVIGGIIQGTRGPVGTVVGSAGTGDLKSYGFDQCGITDPPPYFPTTGRFSRPRIYEVDPTGFDVEAAFDELQSSPIGAPPPGS